MHDIKYIRQYPQEFDTRLARRGLKPLSEQVLQLDKQLRSQQSELEQLQAKRNNTAKQIGAAKAKGEDATEHFKAAEQIKQQIAALERDDKTAKQLRDILVGTPNLPADDTPQGDSEDENIEVSKWGDIPTFNFTPKQHFELPCAQNNMDFESAAKISGARFVVLKNSLAKLERALANFMLDIHIDEHNHIELQTPVLVNDKALFGTGQLPKFEEDLFKTTDGKYLIPTSEAPVTNLVANTILNESDLPQRYTCYSQCFRSEAGSAGKDTRGMIRHHQFSKVEMVSIVKPEDSAAELQRLTKQAEAILQCLKLPYRVVQLCTGDLGFSMHNTYDIEVWMPGQETYREISSCSNAGAFQARRMKARFKRDGQKQTEFVHTLNGSGLAIGRCIAALLENNQQADGSIKIPTALQPYFGSDEIPA